MDQVKLMKIHVCMFLLASIALVGCKSLNTRPANLDQYLQQHHAQALFEMVCVDHLKQADLDCWLKQLEQLSAQKLSRIAQQHDWTALILKNRTCLNSGSQGNPIYQIQLS